jgi:hypothetical protein
MASGPDHELRVRWNSQDGCAYVDGAHMQHKLELGDEITFDNNAPVVNIFEPPNPFRLSQ